MLLALGEISSESLGVGTIRISELDRGDASEILADAVARRMQKAGRKPRESVLYGDLVRRLRGMIETEVNRTLNHAVLLHRPRIIAVEKLDFQGSGLSRRMNRILANCGRGAMTRKLADLHDRHGIEIHEVDPAYTSKTCSCCGYVDARQRSGEKFSCRFCGRRMHADVNGARNIALAITGQPVDHAASAGDGRSALPTRPAPSGRKRKQKASSSSRTRSFALRSIVRRFDESMASLRSVSKPKRGKSGARENAPDPRLGNPYWKRHSLLLKRDPDGPRNAVDAQFAVAT